MDESSNERNSTNESKNESKESFLQTLKVNCLEYYDEPRADRFDNTWIHDRVVLSYLIYVWVLPVFFTFALIEAFVASYANFSREKRIEEIYKYFIYLTNNGRLLAIAAYTYEAVLVSRRCHREIMGTYTVSHYTRLPFYLQFSWFLSNCNSTISVVITVFYWTAIKKNGIFRKLAQVSPEIELERVDFDNLSGHLLIAIFNILNIFISDRVWKVIHFYHPLIIGFGYVLFSLIYYSAGGTNYEQNHFIYAILDYSKPLVALWIFLIVIFAILVHFMFYGLYRLRCIIKSKLKRAKSFDSEEAFIDLEESTSEV